ncbi:phage major capsid protein [Paludisphaera rhizosphaerae]|uniref:phage major capsid protein n=1 Tax=Paludisphaera rhizosphaerae TaxID=2711216 RepID=UPI0013EBCD1A|nr:phage major capsid protein [Paludisphaera rhizosphaerae]
MDANELRRRAAALMRQAEELIDGLEDAPSTEVSEQHDGLVAQAEGLAAQADEMDVRAQRRAALAARMAPTQAAHTDAANTRNGRHQYCAARAMAAQARGLNPDGLEGEVHQDLVRFRPNTRGVLIPLSTEIEYRSFSATGAVGTTVRGPILDALMAKLVLAQAGVQTIVSEGLFKLPLATSGATYWVSGTSPTAADRSIAQAAFTAHTLAGKTFIDRQSLVTANVNIQQGVWNQLLKDIAVGLQVGAFHGSNSAGQPKGLFTYTSGDGVTVLANGTDGGALSYAEVVSMFGAVATANAGDNVAAITNPTVIAKLEVTPRESGYPVYTVNSESQTIAGRPYFSTSSVSNALTKGSGTGLSAIAMGAWDQMAIGMFSAVDVFANPYSNDGGVTLSAFLDCDVQLLHPAAFAISVDVSTA